MAELHIFGQILSATDFEEPNLYCKWSIQIGELYLFAKTWYFLNVPMNVPFAILGSCWKYIEGHYEGQTAINCNRLENISIFAAPIDLHLACRGIQGWPKIAVEVYAVNALNSYWPVGFGFAHIPTQPGFHKINISTWKIAPDSFLSNIKESFYSGGSTITKSELSFSGIERYKLSTNTSGSINIELMLIFKNFSTFGIELK